MRTWSLLGVGVLAAGIAGLGTTAPTERQDEMLVTTEWLERHLDDPEVIVLHVGYSPEAADAAGRHDYEDGHIPRALFVRWSHIAAPRNGLPNEVPPLQDLVAGFRRLGIDENRRVVLYDTGGGLEAARAYVALDYVGLGTKAAFLDGQWKKWWKEERPVWREDPKVEPSRFVPRLRPEIFVHRPAIEDVAWMAARPGGTAVLIDARPEEEFTGKKAGKGVSRPGHIPGAVSVCWMRNIESRENPVLRPDEELRWIYESAGVRPGKIAVAYCRTGVQASHTYFTLKYLGYTARLYDASFVEWSASDSLDVGMGEEAR